MIEQPSFSERDTKLSVWLADPKDPLVLQMRNDVVRLLRSLGWRVQLDPYTKKHYPCISNDHHHAQRGDLQAKLRVSGRVFDIEFFQDIVHENKNGGQYDFDRRKKMPYLIGLQYEAAVRKVAACIESLGLPTLKRDMKLKGQAFIDARRTEHMACHGPKSYDEDRCQTYNRTGADKAMLRDGQSVWLVAEWGPVGRWQAGIAYRNINNMWWVLLPGDVVRNEADFRLHSTPPENPRGRHFSIEHRVKAIDKLKAKAVAAEQFELAARLRDAAKAIRLAA